VSSRINLRPRPEENELRLKRLELEELEKDLVEKELQLAGLHAELLAFERLYLKAVGMLYSELDEIEARIADLLARRHPADKKAQKAAQHAREKARESSSAVGELTLGSGKSFKASAELKNLYREVARRIHPDLATDEADKRRRQLFMASANRAYEEGDDSRLKAILEEYESSPETVVGEGVGAELVRVIRKISQVKRRLSEIADEIKLVEQQESMELKRRVDEGTGQGRDILAEMAAAVIPSQSFRVLVTA
jgi:hypothetical protein